jgi:hypothetical protein
LGHALTIDFGPMLLSLFMEIPLMEIPLSRTPCQTIKSKDVPYKVKKCSPLCRKRHSATDNRSLAKDHFGSGLSATVTSCVPVLCARFGSLLRPKPAAAKAAGLIALAHARQD